MSDTINPPQTSPKPPGINIPLGRLRPNGRSLGLKLMVVCFLVLLMAIPAMFISFISFERSERSDDVAREVAQRYGGEQYVTGPILVAPYGVVEANGFVSSTGQYVVFADEGRAEFTEVETKIRKRSLFKVPTYSGKSTLSATFSLDKKVLEDTGLSIDWSEAEIWMGVTDTRGLQNDVNLVLESGEVRKFTPAQETGYSLQNTLDDNLNRAISKSTSGAISPAFSGAMESVEQADGTVIFQNGSVLRRTEHASLLSRSVQEYISVPASDIVKTTGSFTVTTKMALAGTQRLGVMPFARSTYVKISSDWPDPGFEGGFAPTSQTITNTGFSAEWHVPFLARGIPGEGKAHTFNLNNMSETAMSVKFVSTQHPYRTVNRALKYSILFIGLVFIAYFLFEVMVGVRVHPAQYILIGLAQSVFYMLLLAFSERVGFTPAFAIAALATIGLTSAYAGAVFKAKKYAIQAGIVFTLVYGLLYVLMRMQDFALMVGALAAFAVIALIMYLTRNTNWYGDAEPSSR